MPNSLVATIAGLLATLLLASNMDRGPTADALDDEGDLANDFLEIAVGSPVTVGSGLLNKHTNYTVTVKVRAAR